MIPRQIDIKQLRVIPAFLMGIYAFGIAMNFNIINMPLLSYATLALQLSCAVLAFYLIIRQKTITRQDAVYLAFLLIILVSSVIHGTDFKNWVYITMRCCLILFVFNYYKEHLSPLIIGLTVGFSIVVVAQLYQLITHPEMWLIQDNKTLSEYIMGGNYNQMGGYLIVTMVLNILCCRINKWYYLFMVPMSLICIAIPLIVGSMTATTCIILFVLISVFPWRKLQRIGIYVLFALVALFQVFICFNGQGIENSDWAVWFIEDVLHKDITFTYRTLMWDSGLRVFAESLFIGHGFPDKEWYLTHMSSFAIGPHNLIIGVMIYGGIIGIVLYLQLLMHSVQQSTHTNDRTANIIMASIAIISMMMLMEVYPIPVIFTLFIVAEYYPYWSRQTQFRIVNEQ